MDTVKEMFKFMKHCAERSLRNNIKIKPHLSGSKNKKTMLTKRIDKYKIDSDIDFELGIISKEIYNYEIQIYNEMKDMLKGYEII